MHPSPISSLGTNPAAVSAAEAAVGVIPSTFGTVAVVVVGAVVVVDAGAVVVVGAGVDDAGADVIGVAVVAAGGGAVVVVVDPVVLVVVEARWTRWTTG